MQLKVQKDKNQCLTRRGDIMIYALENKPIRGFYRLIEYAGLSELKRAPYNIPFEPRRGYSPHIERYSRHLRLHRRIGKRYTLRSFMALLSDQFIRLRAMEHVGLTPNITKITK